MKVYITSIFFIFLCISIINCNNSDRTEIISELKKFKTLIIQKDMEELSKYFKFPITDKHIMLLINTEYEDQKGIKSIKEKDFAKYYNSIISKELKNAFNNLNIDDLLKVDRIEKKVYIDKKKIVYYLYEIRIDSNIIKITIDYNHESVENPNNMYGEHQFFYTFIFKDSNLYFKKLELAG